MMIEDASFWGWVFAIAALVAAGALSGTLAGLFGIGGGIIVVPVLFDLGTRLGVSGAVTMHVAVGTSLGVILPTSIRSFLAHRARGAANIALLRSWLVPVPAGAIVAAFVASASSAAVLQLVFGTVAAFVGVLLILGPQRLFRQYQLPKNPLRALVGFTIGVLSALMGVGGGMLNNLFMIVCGRPIHEAVATSAGVGTLIAVPGVIGMILVGWAAPDLPPFSLGYVNLPGMAGVMSGSLVAAPFGAWLAHRLPARILQISLGSFFVVVTIRLLAAAL